MDENVLHINLEQDTLYNQCYRKVIYTNDNMQIILQSLQPGEEVPFETHTDVVQFIRCEKGRGIVTIDGIDYEITDGVCITIPANTEHRIFNDSKRKNLKFYTIYSKPEHTIEENIC